MLIAAKIPVGAKFNRLTILEEAPPQCRIDKFGKLKKMRMVKCKCDCGEEIITRFSALKNGQAKSCNCLRDEMAKISQKKTFTTHGLSKHPLFRRLADMKTRCYNKKSKSYKDYGGRGISICLKWRNETISFYNWAMANGYKKGLQIDRINNNGNYTPSNCRWITKREQSRNRRSNNWLEYNGKRMLITDWAKEFNISSSCISQLLKNKSPKEVLGYYTNKYKKTA